MIFNLLLYFGIFFIVAGFSLFLYVETKLRDIDIQLFKLEQDKRNLYKIADKLENRISTLEKVLASHAKCIGEMREEKKDDI